MVDEGTIRESNLANGIRVISEVMQGSKSASVGIWVNVGSRDEGSSELGCSHFLEHLLFKGTKKRTAQEISTAIESRGGYLNAFTDRDMTCFHAKVLSRDLEVAVNVLSDIVQDPLIRQGDVEKELHVILSEIDARDDDPADLIHDLSFETVWGRSSAARPVLGDRGVLSSMTSGAIRGYYEGNYHPRRILVTCAGEVNHEALVDVLEKGLDLKREGREIDRTAPTFHLQKRHISRKTSQVQVAITSEGLPQPDPDRYALGILNTYLGVGASSKLFQEVREKRGLVYSIFSNVYSLSDGGLLNIVAGTLDRNVEKLLETVTTELKETQKELDISRTEDVKHKTIGMMTLRSENTEARMMQLGVSAVRDGKPKTFSEVIEGINRVDGGQVEELAERLLSQDKFALTTLGLSEETQKRLEVSN